MKCEIRLQPIPQHMHFNHEDGTSKFLWNVSTHLQNCMVSQTGRPQSEWLLLQNGCTALQYHQFVLINKANLPMIHQCYNAQEVWELMLEGWQQMTSDSNAHWFHLLLFRIW
jgi:hypothetical protein